MSFEKRLYEYQVNPPQQMWDKLSSALDDLHFERSFKKKLNVLASPPAIGWEKIEENLNAEIAEILPRKLFDLSETPPADLWNKIDEKLADDDFNKKLSDRLSDLEVTPPVGNWRKIAAGIGEETPVVSISRKYSKPLRYAAAAAFIGLIAWGGVALFKTGNNTVAGITKEQKENNRNQPVDNAAEPTRNQVNNSNTPTLPESKNETQEAISTVNEIIAGAKPVRAKTKLLAAVAPAQESHSGSDEIIADASLMQRNKTSDLNNTSDNAAARYLVYLNDEGSLMKISKKLADLKCIYTKEGEVSQDALAKLDRVICNDIVQCWQEKLAFAPINLSFNPLEMADILK